MRSVASITLACSAMLAAFFALPAPPAAAGKARMDGMERAIVRAVNRQRARYGLGAVHRDRGLARAANYHSRQMLAHDYFAHSSADGGSFDGRVRRFSRHAAVGETLAYMSRCRAGQVVRMWMNSSGHRAILLSSSFQRIGVGRRTGSLGSSRACVVTADFASRR